ncbi:hypothetical protein LCGC14_3102350 [marine sediment metagenome]|uniref:Uncharacterized protein n=1 Tax=marine sediment metagenome TaxID=412755 RepID=A0A0F8W7S1_9ZZZZ
MAKLSEEAQTYVPPTTKNIAELHSVSVGVEVQTKESTKKDGEKFTYKYIEVGGEEYRVPGIVLGQLKEQLKANPNLQKFKVSKIGEGIKTVYTVVPL